jgi:hypothetical protein
VANRSPHIADVAITVDQTRAFGVGEVSSSPLEENLNLGMPFNRQVALDHDTPLPIDLDAEGASKRRTGVAGCPDNGARSNKLVIKLDTVIV